MQLRNRFSPAEVIKSRKTTGQLGSDYNKFNKIWYWVQQNFNSFVYEKVNTALVDATKHMSKMLIARLRLHNLPIPAKINDKRKAALEHKKEYLNSKSMK